MALFICKTNEAHVIKSLSELLQNNLKNSSFEIDGNGIRLKMTDSNKKILIDLELFSDNFSLYKFKPTKKMFIGLNQSHFYKMLKTIKKKDSLVFFINDEKSMDLGIQIIPKEKNRITTSYIKIQNIQHVDIDVPTGYNTPTIVPSNEYQKMCKDMVNISNSIIVTSRKYNIKFSSNAGSIYSREVIFGENDEEDTDNSEVSQEFDTEQLIRICKIAGLGNNNSNNMQIFQKEGLPLVFRSPIGSLGKISIYVKSKDQIEEDEKQSIHEE
jgi:proliferating cell nuclear antigen